MYKAFDTFPEADLHKEREACYNSGSNGEKLAQYITDAREKHNSNAKALSHTVHMFDNDELKSRHRAKLVARFEQERKWVKHFQACEVEHKKGVVVAKLKADMETQRKTFIKKEQDLRLSHERKMDDLRKQCEVDFRKQFEEELKNKQKAKAKLKEANKKKSWWSWLFAKKKPVVQKPVEQKPTPAAMIAKQITNDNEKPVKDREFYLARHKAKKAS